MATIKIKRTSEWVGMARNYKVFIDGQFVGKIANGATKEFPIPPGQHTVVVKIDWCSSPSVFINIETHETKHMTAGGFKYNKILLLGLGISVLHYLIKGITGFGYTIFLLIPIFLLLAYYTTVGRKKYLTLSENK